SPPGRLQAELVHRWLEAYAIHDALPARALSARPGPGSTPPRPDPGSGGLHRGWLEDAFLDPGGTTADHRLSDASCRDAFQSFWRCLGPFQVERNEEAYQLPFPGKRALNRAGSAGSGNCHWPRGPHEVERGGLWCIGCRPERYGGHDTHHSWNSDHLLRDVHQPAIALQWAPGWRIRGGDRLCVRDRKSVV